MTGAFQSPLRFDGRVAIVTGAGGQRPSLGEEYARFLAGHGAKVVVNDLGVGPDGTRGMPANAQATVDEINASGGEAVGDTNSVATPGGARAVVQTAIDTWGRVDIVVNNAGVVFYTLFDEASDIDLQRIVDTHLYGSIWMARAAWPHMKAAGYGRIVNICSDAMHGNPYLVAYGAAKAGIVGLTRGLALEGAKLGIHVNALAPRANTSKHPYMMGIDPSQRRSTLGSVGQVAPAVGYLCHEKCEFNGTVLGAGNGIVREFRDYQTAGLFEPDLTIEHVHANTAHILDQNTAEVIEPMSPDKMDKVPRRAYAPSL